MSKLTRRQMLRNGSLAAVALWTTCKVSGEAPAASPNEKLNIAGIGVGGRGAANVNGCAGENIVALCDVDEKPAAGTFDRYPKARKYRDFRRMLISDYGRHQLLPEEKFRAFERPEPFIPASIGHHREWTEACKTGGPTTCSFDYSGPLTEAALLCNVALRVERKLSWDARNLRAAGCPEADAYLRRAYRDGWTL